MTSPPPGIHWGYERPSRFDCAVLLRDPATGLPRGARCNYWRNIRISNGKTSGKHCDMPRGEPRNVKSCSPARESTPTWRPTNGARQSPSSTGNRFLRFPPLQPDQNVTVHFYPIVSFLGRGNALFRRYKMLCPERTGMQTGCDGPGCDSYRLSQSVYKLLVRTLRIIENSLQCRFLLKG